MIAPDTLLQNRYLVVSQIGQGGMGAVYIATDQRFGSTVALKETFFTDPSLRRAFEREARLLNHLRHPALPRVSDHFVEEEGQFLVMEYIPGEDLAEKLKERGGAFPLNEVLNWADQLLDALDYLHTQEPPVIHRDIKPQNLKLTPRNHIVLLDFGLAKGTPAMQMTATGSVFGYSRNYAPLEQIQGTGTDPRSDLYSLAATLYHLMTGTTPPDALTRATAVLNGQDDPLRPANVVHAQVTPAVAEVISKAMAQNASQRPQTAAAMREALREAARQGLSEARVTKAQASPSTDLYEQETQLIYAAAPATSTDKPATSTDKAGTSTDEAALKTSAMSGAEDAGKTGAVKAAAGATALDAASQSVASPSRTNVEPASVVTKLAAKGEETTGQSRRRVLTVAAVTAVFAVLAAVVYSFMRNTPPATPASNQGVQSAPTAPQTANTDNQNSAASTETPTEADNTAATALPSPATQHTPVKPAKENQAPVTPRKNESAQADEDNPPEPPEPDAMPTPDKRERRGQPPFNDPEFERAMKVAEEQRRAAVEARRQAQEERRKALIKQRIIQEMERRRRQRNQQP